MHDSTTKENETRGITGFPLAYYPVDQRHPKYQMVAHWHLDYEIIHIISGSFLLHLDDQSFVLEKGDLAMVHDGVLHGGTPRDCVYECIVFDPELLRHRNYLDDTFVRDVFHHKVFLTQILKEEEIAKAKDFQEVLGLFLHAVREKEIDPLLVTSSLRLLFGEYRQYHLFSKDSFTEKNGVRRSGQIKEVLEFIEINYNKEITLHNLSSAAGLSEKYFCTFFKEMTGQSPFTYINLLRIEKACVLLQDNEETILSIALDSGFNDQTYFTRTFRKYKGMTPRKYKEKLQ
jgi:AraC-like DNA-binding protein